MNELILKIIIVFLIRRQNNKFNDNNVMKQTLKYIKFMNNEINKEILIKVIREKLFDSTGHNYAHPYIATKSIFGTCFSRHLF
ncbi:hypothetical protein GCM10025884_08670 [Leuconostoc gelidum subsp. gelidum]|nr:hypothetical protein C269_00350 [Leuconostoc gelidum JB7]GMA67240.1 hypothetical protein GCM10025884_08670 [Leuconostoc gelidum subsp. gelidum]